MTRVPSSSPGLVVYRTTGGVDAIAEHSRRLVAAFEVAGYPARYIGDGLASARRAAGRVPWFLLQYNPFSYGRWGVAPRLAADAALLRRQTGATFALLVHEPWAHVTNWRSGLMSVYQRVQLATLLMTADVALSTTQGRSTMLGQPVRPVPVGSNITAVGTTAQEARERFGFSDELVVALFGTGHPSRALACAEAAIDALAARRGAASLRVLNLGRGAPPLRVCADVDVQTPGQLDPEELSWRLWASDVMLLPFTDGVSTRRTTLMAGLAHGLPVVGSRGANTDDVIVHHPEAIALAPVDDLAAFVRTVIVLTEDPTRLRAMGEAGRRLYRSHFDWPVVARRLAAELALTPQAGYRNR